MSRFYTYTEQHKSAILYRYVEDGKHFSERVTETELELFIKTNRDSDSVSLYNEPLLRRQFNNVFEFSKYKKEATSNNTKLYGMTSVQYQFLASEYPDKIEFSMNDITVLCFDIETLIPEDGTFDKPTEARQPITLITSKVFGKNNQTIVFGYQNFYKEKDNEVYIYCNNEEELLYKFVDHFKKVNPDIITGWNIDGYDIPFIITRGQKIIGNYIKQLSPFASKIDDPIKQTTSKDGEVNFEILGVTSLDYMRLYKKFARTPLTSYSLNNVSRVELDEQKVDYSEYKGLNDLYRKNFQKFVEYGIMDTILVERIDNKLNFIAMVVAAAFDGKINFIDVYSQTRYWDTKIYNVLKSRNIQIPPKENFQHVDIPGGYVKVPQVGLHNWSVSFDLNSLYPSIIRLLNMSPETLVQEQTFNMVEDFINLENIDSNRIENCAIAANGSGYTKEFQGLMPELLTISGIERNDYKKQMLDVKKEFSELKAQHDSSLYNQIHELESKAIMLDAFQNAKKVAMNSAYGAMACKYYRYFNPSIASGITLTGQAIIRYIERRVNEFLNDKLKSIDIDYVLLSDTDSIVVNIDPLVDKVVPLDKQADIKYVTAFIDKFANEVLGKFISSCFLEFEEYVNYYESTLKMKRENIANRVFCRAKKTYIMQVTNSEGVDHTDDPKLKIMGVETQRSSTPDVIKAALIDCIKLILNNTEEELQDYIIDIKSKYKSMPIEVIAMPRGVTDMDKFFTGDLTFKSGTPIHVKAALAYNYLIKKYNIAGINPEIINGSKLKFVYLKQPNYIHSNVIGFVDELPKEFELHGMIDYDLMLEKSFLSPVRSFTEILSWDLEHQHTLESFFG